ncbi:NAD(P)H:quinone oxidoreductase, type IV [Mrakia frigida]|uniref:NAD(P)H:quinone oxidoreductase, type IV n=1 Tax=Mrakia frigida TaxID=29902 RepID=UPI003FCC1411
MANIAVIAYSTYGHTNTLAESIIKGINESGAKGTLYQFEETLSADVLAKMYAAPKPAYPVITPDDLKKYDGFIFAFGTRYGRAPAQVSSFFDQTGGLWATGALIGKFGAFATGAAGQHGGHETAIMTSIPFLTHHGIIYVPLGYGNPTLFEETEVIGGSPWGSSYVAGSKGNLPVTDKDKNVAEFQGKSFGTLVSTFVKGKSL